MNPSARVPPPRGKRGQERSAEKRGLSFLTILLALSCIGVLTFGVYFQTLFHGFVFDDKEIILENPRLSGPDQIPRIFTTNYWGDRINLGMYRPLLIFSFAVNSWISGKEAFSFHLANVLIHTANSMLVFILLWKILGSGRTAFFAGLLFGTHPIHTEAVSYVTGRGELLSFTFLSLSLILYIKGTGRAFLATLGLFSLALLTKESSVCFPALAFLTDLYFQRSLKKGLPRYLGLCAILLAWILVRYLVLGEVLDLKGRAIPQADNPLAYVSLFTRWAMALKLVAKYLLLLFFPIRLCVDYSFNSIPVQTGPLKDLLLGGGLLTLILLILISVRKHPLIFLAGTFFFASLFPVSNLPFPIGTIFAERILYLPSIALAILLVSPLPRTFGPRKKSVVFHLAHGLLLLVVLLYGIRTLERNVHWRNNYSLFLSAASVSPGSAKVQNNLGIVLFRHKRFEESVKAFERAIAIKPWDGLIHRSMGNVLLEMGRKEEALRAFKKARELSPGLLRNFARMAMLYEEAGNYPKAEKEYLKALEKNPGDLLVRHSLALLLVRQERFKEAVDWLREGLEKKPDFPPFLSTLSRIGLLQDGWIGEKEAEKLAEKAVSLDPQNFQFLDLLASTYLKNGKKAKALEILKKILALEPTNQEVQRRIKMLEEEH